MANHKVAATDADIDRALEKARSIAQGPRVIGMEYRPGPGLDLIILRMSDGHRLVIPREDLEGLQQATRQQIANVEILGSGTGLHWPDLGVDHYIPNLLQQIYGTRRWMAELGRIGGSARSAAKRKASRQNGLKGGRPRRKDLVA